MRTLVIAAAMVMIVSLGSPALALQAGAAKIDITPPVGVWLSGYGFRNKPSESVADPLYARALVLDDGRTDVAIVSCDLLWVPLEITEKVRRRVGQETGMPADNILICGTHTHFGPRVSGRTAIGPKVSANAVDARYAGALVNHLVDVVVRAKACVVDAQLAEEVGSLPDIAFNRRTLEAKGSAVMTWSVTPEVQRTRVISHDSQGNTVVGFEALKDKLRFGPVDPQVLTLRVADSNERPLMTLVNFACHAVSGSGYHPWDYAISADFPGVMTSIVEEADEGLCMFTAGTCGDIAPLGRGCQERFEMGRALAGQVLRQNQFVNYHDDIDLAAARREIEIPLKDVLRKDRILDADPNAGPLKTEMQCLRLGRTYVLGLPGEILVELGLEIKRRAGVDNLIIIELANDACGYVCHKDAYKQGGYEPSEGTNLAEGAGEIIVADALELIGRMKK